MAVESICVVWSDLPSWLVHGLGIGIGATILVLIVNLIGVRYIEIRSSSGERIDADELKHAEVRAYLQAIGEPFMERMPIDDLEVEFWLTEREMAITFDPHVYFDLIERGQAAVLLEHEVPGQHIGSRLPFDTPPLETATPVSHELSWAYETLGVEVGAEQAAIDAAYRERVLESHPDRGGDSGELADVLLAYERLGAEAP